MFIQAAGATRVGRVRHINQDAFCSEPELGLLAVADGVGGRPAGDVASRLAIATLLDYVRQGQRTPEPELLADAVEAANVAIRRVAAQAPDCQSMATTLTACLIRDRQAHFAHIGDSRAYLLRHGDCQRLTEDHTMAGLRRKPGVSAPPASRALLAALGLNSWVGADIFSHALCAGDVLLLCTDGVTRAISQEELAGVGGSASPLAERCQILLNLADERGGEDNATVILATFDEMP